LRQTDKQTENKPTIITDAAAAAAAATAYPAFLALDSFYRKYSSFSYEVIKQTDRQTNKQTDKQVDRQKNKQ
jgi:hypothetical protein